VVMLWPNKAMKFNPGWQPAGGIRLGESMASLG
jgi:phosphatidylserine decarboxylase